MIDPGDVRPGKCFAIRGGQGVRRVVAVKQGIVTFEARTLKLTRRDWPTRLEAPMSAFVEEAEIEVGCDYVAGGSDDLLFV